MEKFIVESQDSEWTKWIGAKVNGYPRFSLDGKIWYAHRLLNTLLSGELKPEEKVLHTCDNPECMNPDHHFRGTQADNMQDMARKGRAPPGRPRLLTPRQAREVRESEHSGMYLARQLGVSPQLITKIRKGGYEPKHS